MTTIPFFATGQEGGLDDRGYIRRLRELIGDVPKAADEQGTGLGNALRYNMQTVPVNDDDLFSVTVNGTAQTVVMTPTPTAGQVFVDFDTGRMIYGTPPPSTPANNITIIKNTVRWRDSTLKEALMDGARNMWPKLGKRNVDQSLTLSTLNWDYALPALFNDPNIRIYDVGVREIPASAEFFHSIGDWEQTSLTNIRIPISQGFAPGSTLEIKYEGPYGSLSEVEPKAQMLPLWWAAGTLLGFKEAVRVRSDTQNVNAEASANPPGTQQNTGAWFIRQFYTSLNQMSRPRRAVAAGTMYNR